MTDATILWVNCAVWAHLLIFLELSGPAVQVIAARGVIFALAAASAYGALL